MSVMLVSDVVTRVLRKFGDDASVQIEEADIIRYINDGIREISIQNDIGQTTATNNVVKDQSAYPVPTDVMAMRTLYYNGTRLKYLTKAEYDQYINNEDPTEIATGEPTFWYKWAAQFIVYPKPSTSVTGGFRLQYLRKPFTITVTTDELPIASEYYNRVVEYCLQQAYETDEDWDAASQMEGKFQDGLTRLTQQQTFADSVEFYPTVTVLPDDAGYY